MTLAIIVPADFLSFRFKGFAQTSESLLILILPICLHHRYSDVSSSSISDSVSKSFILRLSWVDTTASIFGCLCGHNTANSLLAFPSYASWWHASQVSCWFHTCRCHGAAAALGSWGSIARIHNGSPWNGKAVLSVVSRQVRVW